MAALSPTCAPLAVITTVSHHLQYIHHKTISKNVFYKKQELEYIAYQTTMSVLVDSMIMNISDFYNQNKLDTDRPEEHLIEFNKLQNIDYLLFLFSAYTVGENVVL